MDKEEGWRAFRESMEPHFRRFRRNLFVDEGIVAQYPEPAFRERFLREAYDVRLRAEFEEIAARPGDLLQNMLAHLYIQSAEPVNDNGAPAEARNPIEEWRGRVPAPEPAPGKSKDPEIER